MNEWMNDGNKGMVMTITTDKVSLTLIPLGMPKKLCMTEWDRWHSCSEYKFHVF